MPEDTISESQATPVFDEFAAEAAEDSGSLNVGFLLLLVVIVALVAVQNLWLRRRAERCVVELSESEGIPAELLGYLNRLSDFFFVLGRARAHRSGADEIAWPLKET